MFRVYKHDRVIAKVRSRERKILARKFPCEAFQVHCDVSPLEKYPLNLKNLYNDQAYRSKLKT